MVRLGSLEWQTHDGRSLPPSDEETDVPGEWLGWDSLRVGDTSQWLVGDGALNGDGDWLFEIICEGCRGWGWGRGVWDADWEAFDHHLDSDFITSETLLRQRAMSPLPIGIYITIKMLPIRTTEQRTLHQFERLIMGKSIRLDIEHTDTPQLTNHNPEKLGRPSADVTSLSCL